MELNQQIGEIQPSSTDYEEFTNWDNICRQITVDSLSNSEMHTDGSWAQYADPIDKILMRKGNNSSLRTVASGSIVISSRGDDWKNEQIILIKITDMEKMNPKSAYNVELV